MIRWKYVIPRFAVLGLLLLAVWLSMNPVLRWSLVRIGQSATGAKVEISQLKTLLASSKLQIRDIHFADPNSAMKNLFQADNASLDIDNSAPLRRQFVIKQGRISGIQLGGQRTSDGRIEKTTESTTESDESGPGIGGQLGKAGERWLESTAGRMGQQLEEDLESVRVSRDLMTRWPAEYDRLEQQAKHIEQQGKALAEQVQKIKQNPLEALNSAQKTAADIDQLVRKTVATKDELRRIQQQIYNDRRTIQRAKQHDEKYIREKLQVEGLDPESLSQYLLGEEMGGRVGQLIGWIQWARSFMPENGDSPAAMQRGLDVLLPGMKQAPTLLARKLALDGSGSSGTEPFRFSGELTNLTTQPKLHGQPAVLSIESKGAVEMTLRAELDHTGDDPIDRVVIHCPQLKQPQRLLGDAEKLAVGVSPGNSMLEVNLTMVRSSLSGTISMRQDGVSFSPSVSEKLGGALVASRVKTTLDQVRSLDATLELDGTLLKPKMKLRSNLGREIGRGLNAAFRQELAARQQQLLAKAHQEVDDEVAKLERHLVQRQNEVFKKLQMGDEQITELKQRLASQFGLPSDLQGGKNALLNGLMRKAGLR